MEKINKLSINTENIETLIKAGVEINKYEDPVEGEQRGLTAEEALEVAREDASLLWVDMAQVVADSDFGDCYPVLADGEIAGVISGYDLGNDYEIINDFWAMDAETLYHRLDSEEFAVLDRDGDNMGNARIRAAWDTLHVYVDDAQGYQFMDGDDVIYLQQTTEIVPVDRELV